MVAPLSHLTLEEVARTAGEVEVRSGVGDAGNAVMLFDVERMDPAVDAVTTMSKQLELELNCTESPPEFAVKSFPSTTMFTAGSVEPAGVHWKNQLLLETSVCRLCDADAVPCDPTSRLY